MILKFCFGGTFLFSPLTMSNTRHTLGATERMKSRNATIRVFSQGKRISHPPLQLVFLAAAQADDQPLQAGFSVSSRHFKKATQRNRIKRLMREAYRTQKHDLRQILRERGHQLHLFFIYIGRELPVYAELHEHMRGALSRLQKYDQHVRL